MFEFETLFLREIEWTIGYKYIENFQESLLRVISNFHK